MKGKDVLIENKLVAKSTTMKRFEYWLLRKELKAQTDIAKKQCQKLGNTFEFNKMIKKKKSTLENYSISNLIYNANHSFYKYCRDSKKFNIVSLKSKYSFLVKFLNKSNKLKKKQKKKKI